jgi:inner membrane protein
LEESVLDNVTHALCGLGIYGVWAAASGHTGLTGDPALGACLAAVIGSEAPDFDYAVRVVKGPVAYLRQHRAVSHSIPAWLIWPLIISLILSLWWHGHFGLFYALALAGVLVHVGLDVLTSYGTQALWPLSGRRYALDCLFIVDLVLILCGFAGIAMTIRHWPIGKSVFVFGGLACLYIAWRCAHAGFLYERLRKQFPKADRVSVLPGPMPWWWSFVVQEGNEIIAGRLDNVGGVRPEVRWHQQEASDIAQYAFTHSQVGPVFRWFARHLIWTETEVDGVVHVTMADATYRYNKTFPFTANVRVRPSTEGSGFEIVAESLRAEEIDRQALLRQLLTGGADGDRDDDAPTKFRLPSPKR